MVEFYNRTSFWLFILDIPHLHGKELLSAIKIKLCSLYPGNISECNIQVRKNGAKKGSYIVFVLNKNTGNEMLPLSPLFIQSLYEQKDADVLYADKKWLDFIRIENGIIKSSTVKARSETTTPEEIKALCAEAENLFIYCDNEDKKTFDAISENICFFDNKTELKKADIYKISLFSEKSPVIKRRRFLMSAAAVFILVLFFWLFFQHRQAENERNAKLRLEQELMQKAALETQKQNKRLEELKKQYNEIINNKTATPFDISSVISECSEQQTRINAATFNGNFFQIEGITGGSLGLLHNFENHYMVENARLHQVHPFGNRDTFTLSGNVYRKMAPIDEELPVSEQIANLEELIAMETNYSITDAQLSPSSFGAAVNTLFKKWGCAVNSYQFMNEPQKTELEISLRGNGNAFFNALYEIKTKHRLWDVHLTQIRNLYPRNMLDIIVRIRTEFTNIKTDNVTVMAESDTPFPVSSISRNYFMPQAVPTEAHRQIRIAEQPPSVSPSISAERVSWLEYIGSIYDESTGRFVYVKDIRTGEIIKLGQHSEGDMRYALVPTGGIIAYINEHIYEIKRR